MPEGNVNLPPAHDHVGVSLCQLKKGEPDAIGAEVQSIEFRGDDYVIYRSDRGVYVHFSDDKEIHRDQVAEYVKLSTQLCELRYLTNQMRPAIINKIFHRPQHATLFDHNMGQALMLLMETAAQRRAKRDAEADTTEKHATDIAQRALDMAILRNTADNTIRYVRACVTGGLVWLGALFLLQHFFTGMGKGTGYVIASAAGVLGAMFSVVVRAQSFELKPCDDSNLNYMMSCIRVGMGGIAGPILLLLVMTVFSNPVPGMTDFASEQTLTVSLIQTICIIGFLAGFAERLVPNLVLAAADKMAIRAGTPGQAAQGKTGDKTSAASQKEQPPATEQGPGTGTRTPPD